MKWRQIIACFVSVALVATQTSLKAQSHEMGVEAGQAANAALRGQVNAARAGAVLPGYGTPAPQTAYSGRPNVGPEANALLTACLLTPDNPNCRALTTAINSANTPRTTYSIADPLVRDARNVSRNPSTATIANLASYYSSCTVGSVGTAASTETRTCNRYTGSGPFTCSNQLTIDVTKTSSCNASEWFASASSGSLNLATQCLPGWNGKQQHFRLMNGGTVLSYFDVDMTAMSIMPQVVATWDAPGVFGDWLPRKVKAYAADRSCNGTTCSLTVLIEEPQAICTGDWESGQVCTDVPLWIPVYAACPAGTVSGDTLSYEECSGYGDGVSCTTGTRDATMCYAPSATPTAIFSGSSGTGYQYWNAAGSRSITGYTINPAYSNPRTISLSYPQPVNTATVRDTWVNTCPTVSDGRCSVATPLTCVDGPATRDVEGVAVTRDCWKQEASMQCTGATTTDQCAQFAAQGCTPTGTSVCTRNDPVTGACTAFRDTYTCPVAAGTAQSVSGCPNDVFCVGSSCFNTKAMADGDFARSMSMLEAAREAGTYLDTDRMQIFSGVGDTCRNRLLVNCCDADSSGKGMTNQSSLGLGTKLVYDVLFNAQNRKFIMQAIQGFLENYGVLDPGTSAASTGTFSLSYYGVTATYTEAAVGVSTGATGAAVGSAGEMTAAEAFSETTVASASASESIVIYSYTTEAGSTFTLAFDPWSLVIAIVIAIILAAMECSEHEAILAMREGAKLCHTVGDWCSSCFRVLGHCVSCITRTSGKCCFNSMIARIINEQGRAQIGKGWGSPQNLDCSGFTLAQLTSLDFGTMDLSEFYASIVPNAINFGDAQNRAVTTPTNCYYGQGRCQ